MKDILQILESSKPYSDEVLIMLGEVLISPIELLELPFPDILKQLGNFFLNNIRNILEGTDITYEGFCNDEGKGLANFIVNKKIHAQGKVPIYESLTREESKNTWKNFLQAHFAGENLQALSQQIIHRILLEDLGRGSTQQFPANNVIERVVSLIIYFDAAIKSKKMTQTELEKFSARQLYVPDISQLETDCDHAIYRLRKCLINLLKSYPAVDSAMYKYAQSCQKKLQDFSGQINTALTDMVRSLRNFRGIETNGVKLLSHIQKYQALQTKVGKNLLLTETTLALIVAEPAPEIVLERQNRLIEIAEILKQMSARWDLFASSTSSVQLSTSSPKSSCQLILENLIGTEVLETFAGELKLAKMLRLYSDSEISNYNDELLKKFFFAPVQSHIENFHEIDKKLKELSQKIQNSYFFYLKNDNNGKINFLEKVADAYVELKNLQECISKAKYEIELCNDIVYQVYEGSVIDRVAQALKAYEIIESRASKDMQYVSDFIGWLNNIDPDEEKRGKIRLAKIEACITEFTALHGKYIEITKNYQNNKVQTDETFNLQLDYLLAGKIEDSHLLALSDLFEIRKKIFDGYVNQTEEIYVKLAQIAEDVTNLIKSLPGAMLYFSGSLISGSEKLITQLEKIVIQRTQLRNERQREEELRNICGELKAPVEESPPSHFGMQANFFQPPANGDVRVAEVLDRSNAAGI